MEHRQRPARPSPFTILFHVKQLFGIHKRAERYRERSHFIVLPGPSIRGNMRALRVWI